LVVTAGGYQFGIPWIAVPIRIVEVLAGFDKVVGGEAVLTFVSVGPPTNDLLELDHGTAIQLVLSEDQT